MCETDLIEFEDENFNYYMHHFNECEGEYLTYNDEYDCMDVTADLIEEILWS